MKQRWNPRTRWEGDALVVPVSCDSRRCLVKIDVLEIAKQGAAKAWANRTGRARFMRGVITARSVS